MIVVCGLLCVVWIWTGRLAGWWQRGDLVEEVDGCIWTGRLVGGNGVDGWWMVDGGWIIKRKLDDDTISKAK